MRRFLKIFTLFLPLVSLGQISPYTKNWDTDTTIDWTPGSSILYNLTTEVPCSGAQAVRTRLQGNQNLSVATLRSPSLGTTLGGYIAYSLDYKWVEYSGNMLGQVNGANPTSLEMLLQWSDSSSGPWYTFKTVDGSNHSVSSTCTTITGQFTPKPGPLFVRVVAKNLSVGGNNYLYLDNINFTEGALPTCNMPLDPYVSLKTSRQVTVNWNAATGTFTGYDWEIRTSGVPGSGGGGYVDSGQTPATQRTFTSQVNGLQPQTNYKIYVRAICSATESSEWIGIDVTTFCDAPTPNVPSNVNICGIQSVDINVTGTGGGTTYFYDVNGVLVHSGTNTFTTPVLSASTSYEVFTGLPSSNNTSAVIGTGSSTSTQSTPFSNMKSNKLQLIYLADELKQAGFSRGVIRNISFKSGNTLGTAVRNGFTIHMGLTNLEEYSTDASGNSKFIPTDRLSLVKQSVTQTLVVSNDNLFTLDNAFVWDGESNLVVQFTYANPTGAKPAATNFEVNNFTGDQSYKALFAGDDLSTLTAMNNLVNGTKSYFRVKPTLQFLDGCFSTNNKVNVNYTQAPNLVLSTYDVNNCAGQPLQTLYVLTGAADYDTFEWGPNDPNDPNNPNNASNAIIGDQNTGWTFNPTQDITYTLKASNSTGTRCVIEQTVNVRFSTAPQLLQISDDYKLCFNDIQEVKVLDNVNDSRTNYLFNTNISDVTLSNNVVGDGISHDTSVFSEGTGSLKISYAAQSNQAVTINTPLNMSNLKGLEVEFDQIAALQATNTTVEDYGFVEYSIDNGVTWKPFLKDNYVGAASKTLPAPVGQTNVNTMFFTKTSYSNWSTIQQATVPASALFKTEKFVIPAADVTGSGSFKMRFRIGSDGNTQFQGWYIDNVKIKPVNNFQVTWSPVANLYYDQAATVPYDGLINTGKLYIKGTTNSANVNYTVSVVNKFGCSAQDIFKVSIGLDKAPVTNAITKCGPLDVANTNFAKEPNGTLRYYDSLTSNVPLTQITTSGVYYVEQEISGCKSDRVAFTVVITSVASNPVAPAIQNFCGSATVDNLQYTPVTGFQLKWYQTSVGGTALANTTPLASGTYFAEFDNGSCISPARTAVSVTVAVTPMPITLATVNICGTNTPINSINVTASQGATVNWYQNIGDTTPLLGTTNLATGTYYIAQKVGACESARTAVTVNTIQNLGLPNAVAQTFCSSATVSNLVASGDAGAVINWYSFSTSDTPLPGSTPISSGTYYVGQSIGDCDSPKRAISVTIISTNAPAIAPLNICGAATVSTLPLNTSANTTFKVYVSPFATTEMNQNDVILSGTYYISKVENACESARAAVQVTVNTRPGSATGNSTQTFVDSAIVSNLTMNEPNIVWFASYNDALNNVHPLPTYQPLGNGVTYYAVIVGAGGCSSIPTPVTVVITLATKDLDLASLKYYPNPTDSELNISYKEAIKSVEVFDILGKQVKAEKFDTTDVRINVSNLASGTYMIKVTTENGSQFVKVVKR